MVTAEAAIVLPLIAMFALVMVWVTSIGIAQVRVVDAARDAARAVARGDDTGSAISAARRTAGAQAKIDIDRQGALVSVTVSEAVAAPRWLLITLPSVTVRSQSSVEVEEAPNGP